MLALVVWRAVFGESLQIETAEMARLKMQDRSVVFLREGLYSRAQRRSRGFFNRLVIDSRRLVGRFLIVFLRVDS